MRFDVLQEAAVGNCLVRIRGSRLELPGVTGWIGGRSRWRGAGRRFTALARGVGAVTWW
jgi:hypothetical protein